MAFAKWARFQLDACLRLMLTMSVNSGPKSHIARVKLVTDDGHQIHLVYPDGQTSTASNDEFSFGLGVGDTVELDPKTGHIQQIPEEMWPGEQPWVGVVRLKLDDVTVLSQSGTLRLVDTNEAEYRVGNTVEARDSVGVVRVLHEKPLRLLETGDPADEGQTFRKEVDKGSLKFDDFGGLGDVVDRARELIEVPLEHHEQLSEIGARPIKGVLFTGPPGTGKTMLAKIIASQSDAAFYEISGPQIFTKWYGESEEILRKIFEDAAQQQRSIIFFDEIDSVAGHRDEDSHEASRRVVAQLLTLMDGFTPDNVVVVATTNRPQDIDVALRRPGRFDWEIDFRLPDLRDREAILQVSARGLKTADDLPHGRVATKSEGWSAAELTAIWSEAALLAVADNRSRIIEEDYLGGFARVAEQRRRTELEEKAEEVEP